MKNSRLENYVYIKPPFIGSQMAAQCGKAFVLEWMKIPLELEDRFFDAIRTTDMSEKFVGYMAEEQYHSWHPGYWSFPATLLVSLIESVFETMFSDSNQMAYMNYGIDNMRMFCPFSPQNARLHVGLKEVRAHRLGELLTCQFLWEGEKSGGVLSLDTYFLKLDPHHRKLMYEDYRNRYRENSPESFEKQEAKYAKLKSLPEEIANRYHQGVSDIEIEKTSKP